MIYLQSSAVIWKTHFLYSNSVLEGLFTIFFITLQLPLRSLIMNNLDQLSFIFSCNVSPSETPKLDISVTKSEPLTIAVPMTIFYSIVFFFGVCTLKFPRHTAVISLVVQWMWQQNDVQTIYCKSSIVLPLMLYRSYSMVWAFWLSLWMLIWESVPFVSIYSASLYQVHTVLPGKSWMGWG